MIKVCSDVKNSWLILPKLSDDINQLLRLAKIELQKHQLSFKVCLLFLPFNATLAIESKLAAINRDSQVKQSRNKLTRDTIFSTVNDDHIALVSEVIKKKMIRR